MLYWEKMTENLPKSLESYNNARLDQNMYHKNQILEWLTDKIKEIDRQSQNGEIYRSIETLEEDAYFKGKFDGMQQIIKILRE